MSLILEALKKSERQRQVGTAPTLATPAMTRRAKRSRLPWLLAAIVVAAGAGWWLSRGDAPTPETPAVASPPTPKQAPPAAESIKPATPMTTVTPPPAAPASVPAAVPAPAISTEKKVAEAAAAIAAAAPRTDAETAAPPAAAPPPVPPPAPRTSPTPTGPVAAAPAAAAPPAAAVAPATAPAAAAPSASAGLPLLWELPYEKRKDLPKLGMSLQVYSADPANRFAIVNDERRKEGDTLGEGLVLREITPDGLIIEFQGERFLYPRGGR